MNNPEDLDAGTRKVKLGREVFIEREDFMVDAPKKYFRLAPGQAVRLRGGYILNYLSHEMGDDGVVKEVRVEALEGTIGENAPEGVKCKAAVHWVSVDHAVEAEVRLYDRLFTEENPDGFEGGYMKCLNSDSLEVVEGAKVEAAAGDVEAGYVCQFERVGYFCTDSKDHVRGEKVVFNRTVELRAAKF